MEIELDKDLELDIYIQKWEASVLKTIPLILKYETSLISKEFYQL